MNTLPAASQLGLLAGLAAPTAPEKSDFPSSQSAPKRKSGLHPAVGSSQRSAAEPTAHLGTGRHDVNDGGETSHDELQVRIADRLFSESSEMGVLYRSNKRDTEFLHRDDGALEATGSPKYFHSNDDYFGASHHSTEHGDFDSNLHPGRDSHDTNDDRIQLLERFTNESHVDVQDAQNAADSTTTTKDSTRKGSNGPAYGLQNGAAKRQLKRKGKSNISSSRESVALVTNRLIKFRNETLVGHLQRIVAAGGGSSQSRGKSFKRNLAEGAECTDQGKGRGSKPPKACYTLLGHSPKPDTYQDLKVFLSQDPRDVLQSNTESFWLDVYHAGNDDLEMMEKVFGLHPLTVEDVLSDDTREKVVVFDEYLFICIHSYSNFDDNDQDDEDNQPRKDDFNMVDNGFVHICLFSDYVITFHAKRSPSIDRVYKRLCRPERLVQQQHGVRGDWVVNFLLDEILELHAPLVDAAEIEVESLYDLVLTLSGSEQTDMLCRMGSVRKRLVVLFRRLHPKRDILGSMLSHTIPHVTKSTTLYLRSVRDHVLGFLMRIEVSKEILTTAQSQYLGKVSIEVASLSNQIAVVMKRLTFGTTILLPMTLISGIFGMNIKVPFQLGDSSMTDINDTLYPFLIVLSFMLLVAVCVVLLVKHTERLAVVQRRAPLPAWFVK